jgi:hypothetical protein
MARRWDVAAVFTVSWRRSARGRGLYAWRSLAVLAALAVPMGVAASLASTEWGQLMPRFLRFAYQAVMTAELILAFGLAPAMTAGSVCDERRKGRLADVLVTDLSPREIVSGKLLAALAGLAMVVASILPALLLTSILGGIDPVEVVAGSIVVLGVGSVTASLSLLLSIRARRTVEAMTTAAASILAVSLMAYSWRRYIGPPPLWVRATSPWALLSDRAQSGFSTEWLVFVVLCLASTSALVALASWRLRPDGLRERVSAPPIRRMMDGHPSKRRDSTASRIASAFLSTLRVPSRSWDRFDRIVGRRLSMPDPTLDADPSLWRSWRRGESSWMRLVWLAYGVIAIGSAVLYVDQWHEAQVNGYLVSAGMLLVGVSAATAWDDDRGRDAFVPLLMTDLSAREIVRGAWWGCYRVVPRLAILPALIVLLRGLIWGQPLAALPMAVAAGALVLAYGTVAVGIGLWVGLREPRSGRAVAITLALLLLANDAWPWVWSQAFGVHIIGADRWSYVLLAWVSPWYASYLATAWVFFLKRQPELLSFLFSVPVWAAWLAAIGWLLRRSVERRFDRQAGRTPDQAISAAAAEKVSALMSDEYLKVRAARGNRAAFDRVLAKVPDVEAEGEDRIDPQVTPMGAG